MATARLDLRLDEEIKAKAEKASALLGLKSLTEYVVRLMKVYGFRRLALSKAKPNKHSKSVRAVGFRAFTFVGRRGRTCATTG